jgi:hypothetical protein
MQKILILILFITAYGTAPALPLTHEEDPLKQVMPSRKPQEKYLDAKPPNIDKNSFDTAFLEFKNHCISNVCIGDKLSDVKKYSQLIWENSNEQPNGKIICSKTFSYQASLLLGNGQTVRANFVQTKTTGTTEERYRVKQVRYLFMDANNFQREVLVQKLVDRFAPIKYIQDVAFDIWTKKMPSGNSRFTIVLFKLGADAPEISRKAVDSIYIQMDYDYIDRWLGLHKNCMAGIPEI